MEKYLVKVFNKVTRTTKKFTYDSIEQAQQKAKSYRRDPSNGVTILRVSGGR
jgi:peptide subunit release factor 1 (eRF1)